MEELTNWKVITALLGLISMGIIYWRKSKDKADEDAVKEMKRIEKYAKDGRDAIYKHLDENQKKVLGKLDEVLDGQHSTDLKLEKAFNGIKTNTDNIKTVTNKQEKALEELSEVKLSQGVNEEWKKRVEDKLDM